MLTKGHKIAHVTHSHTDCSDVWELYFEQMNKYWNTGMKNFFLVNKTNLKIPNKYKKFEYGDSQSYSDRLISCLSSLGEYEYIFFDHEDMFLYGSPDYDEINLYLELLFAKKFDYIRLIKSTNCKFKPIDNLKTLFEIDLNSKWIFSIQPSFWNRLELLNLIKQSKNCNGWELEVKSQKALRKLKIKSAFSHREGNKRGMHHFDNDVYPYIATAIIKGKWNTSEYPSELMKLFDEYKIDPSIRGNI